MRSKQANSEADGLFMKANRKHQILLNFELKRIAVEQKMRERYFAFEKSLVIAHQEKIINRQKTLGIYRPQTTPDKKRPKDSFFITAVAMETKARMKLPPVVDGKGGTRGGAPKRREKGTKIKAERDHASSYNILIHERPKENESLPVLKQGFAVVQARKESSSKTAAKNAAVSSSIKRIEPEENDSQARDEKGEKCHDGIRKNGIENEQTGKDLKELTNGANNTANIGTISDSQTGENVEKAGVKVVSKENEERNEESKSKLLEDSAPGNGQESGENISENRDKDTSNSVQNFKQRDENIVRSKSVLSGVIDDNSTWKGSVLRAQSAGVQGWATKIAS